MAGMLPTAHKAAAVWSFSHPRRISAAAFQCSKALQAQGRERHAPQGPPPRRQAAGGQQPVPNQERPPRAPTAAGALLRRAGGDAAQRDHTRRRKGGGDGGGARAARPAGRAPAARLHRARARCACMGRCMGWAWPVPLHLHARGPDAGPDAHLKPTRAASNQPPPLPPCVQVGQGLTGRVAVTHTEGFTKEECSRALDLLSKCFPPDTDPCWQVPPALEQGRAVTPAPAELAACGSRMLHC